MFFCSELLSLIIYIKKYILARLFFEYLMQFDNELYQKIQSFIQHNKSMRNQIFHKKYRPSNINPAKNTLNLEPTPKKSATTQNIRKTRNSNSLKDLQDISLEIKRIKFSKDIPEINLVQPQKKEIKVKIF